MKKIDSLKNQYPELNLSLIDLLTIADGTKSKKYLPFLCKIVSEELNNNRDYHGYVAEAMGILNERKIEYDGFPITKILILGALSDCIYSEVFDIFNKFKDYNERGLIEQNDILTYKNLNEVRNVVNIASLKVDFKDMEKKIIKIFEDDTWLMIKPLTFEASSKYGANTKWCTTFTKDKSYFARYWRNGILVYFINKQNGEKYAVYKGLRGDMDREISWWDSQDTKIDFTITSIDPYLLPHIKNVLTDNVCNKDLCDHEMRSQVEEECDPTYYQNTLERAQFANLMQTSLFEEEDFIGPRNQPVEIQRHSIFFEQQRIQEERLMEQLRNEMTVRTRQF